MLILNEEAIEHMSRHSRKVRFEVVHYVVLVCAQNVTILST